MTKPMKYEPNARLAPQLEAFIRMGLEVPIFIIPTEVLQDEADAQLVRSYVGAFSFDLSRDVGGFTTILAKPAGWVAVPVKAKAEGVSFSVALEAIKEGKRVARAGWNGEGMWLMLVRADQLVSSDSRAKPGEIEFDDGYEDGVVRKLLPWIGMKTADDMFVPWLASQTDVLAEDWSTLS